MHIRRITAALSAACLVGVGLVASATGANAAIGDEIIVNGDFSDTLPDGSLVGASTEFTLADNTIQGSSYGLNSMYDEGRYVVGTNPYDYHVLWANQPSDNPKMIVNGFTEDNDQIVWEQSNPGLVCPAGDQVTYDFSATVANILPQSQYSDGGAAITVVINDVVVANVDLTDNDGTPVVLEGNLVPAAEIVTLSILNGSTVRIGNDFSLDDISLVQTSDCLTPVPVQFDVPTTLPTCESGAMFDAVFPIVREGYTLTVDRPYDGPGVYTITATAAEGYVFSGDGDPTVRTTTVTLAGAVTGPQCHVGGLTIGYYKNHAVSEATWDAASAAYPAIFSGLDTWAKALAVLNAANNKDDGTAMLRAQAIAFALNIETIDGFGEQHVTGTTTAAQYLAWVNSAWGTAALDTKAERTAVKDILDAANQHA
jgi:hypothetical protein